MAERDAGDATEFRHAVARRRFRQRREQRAHAFEPEHVVPPTGERRRPSVEDQLDVVEVRRDERALQPPVQCVHERLNLLRHA